jgi:Ser/Thr protein kinase RdoA (MazF antagonist)
MNAAEQAALCRQFCLGEPGGCELAGGTRNVNCLLQTERGAFFVRKRFAGYSAPARISFDHRALEFLRSQNVSVAAPRKSSSGDTYWKTQEAVYEVFPALPGRHLRDGDEGDIRLLAAALTQFHRAGRSFSERLEKLGPRGETDPCHLLNAARGICEQSPDCAEAITPYMQWIESSQRTLSDERFASLPHTLVHGDVQPANVLVDGQRVSFVDFDWCAWRPRVYDLAFAILMCCSKHSAPIRSEDIWSLSQPLEVMPQLARCLMDGCAAADWPLSEAELAALPPQILLSWCSCRLAGAAKVARAQWSEFLSRPPRDSRALCPDALF